MSTHDYVIDNQSAPALRADLNNVLQAIVTQNSSATAPTVTYADMIWYDSANNQLKKRNEANSAWITLGTIDETAGTFTPSGGSLINTQTFTTSGTWTKPSNVNFVLVRMRGAGQGGSSGNVGSTAADTRGSSGGSGGSYVEKIYLASSLPSTVLITVGAGGAGGAALVATSVANGNAGIAGGNTTFGTLLTAKGGGQGYGADDPEALCLADDGAIGGAPVSVNSPNPSSGSTSSAGAGCGGGAGAGLTTAAGGVVNGASGGGAFGGAGGVGNTSTPTAGSAGTNNGGGGGGGSTTTATNAGAGGNGGPLGGGGGGGGANRSGSSSRFSGAGGNGGNGYAQVISW